MTKASGCPLPFLFFNVSNLEEYSMKLLRGSAAAVAVLGSLATANVGAVNIATDGIGEVAIAPYYTTREGFQTLVNLTNTTSSQIIVKVRFHEALNSRDVLDFNVFLSSFDVFTGVVRAATAADVDGGVAECVDSTTGQACTVGQPIFVNTDQQNSVGNRTCVAPQAISSGTKVALSRLGFGDVSGNSTFNASTNPNSDNGPNTTDRLAEGYIEFIVMGHTNFTAPAPGATPAAASGNPLFAAGVAAAGGNPAGFGQGTQLGQAIETHNCGPIDAAFSSARGDSDGDGIVDILEVARQVGEPINSLKFNFRLLNAEQGIEAGNSATTWANFYNPGNGSLAASTGFRVQPSDNANCTINRGDERVDAGNDGVRDFEWVPNASDSAIAPVAGAAQNTNAGNTITGSCRNLITAQTNFPFLEPSLNDAFPQTANFFDDTSNAFVSAAAVYPTTQAAPENVRGVDAMSLTIQRQSITNEWSVNPALGVTTDWIVTSPTKGMYVDGNPLLTTGTPPVAVNSAVGPQYAVIDNNIAGNSVREETNIVRVNAAGANPAGSIRQVPYAPFANAFARATATDPTTARSCEVVGISVYDRAEQSPGAPAGSGSIVSPAPPPVQTSQNICYESTVVTFGNNSRLGNGLNRLRDQNGAAVNVAVAAPTLVNAAGTANPAGWARLAFTQTTQQMAYDDVNIGGAAGADRGLQGLPVIGFNLKVRTFGTGNLSQNNASSLDHGFTRTILTAAPAIP